MLRRRGRLEPKCKSEFCVFHEVSAFWKAARGDLTIGQTWGEVVVSPEASRSCDPITKEIRAKHMLCAHHCGADMAATKLSLEQPMRYFQGSSKSSYRRRMKTSWGRFGSVPCAPGS